jgi:hypothetical protein
MTKPKGLGWNEEVILNTTGTKQCSRCKVTRDLQDFYQTGKTSGKLRAECKYCLKERKVKLSKLKEDCELYRRMENYNL